MGAQAPEIDLYRFFIGFAPVQFGRQAVSHPAVSLSSGIADIPRLQFQLRMATYLQVQKVEAAFQCTDSLHWQFLFIGSIIK